jgi:hypothetical protein
MFAAGDRQVADHVQTVAAAHGPARDDRDHHLGHHPDQALHLENVEAAGAAGSPY